MTGGRYRPVYVHKLEAGARRRRQAWSPGGTASSASRSWRARRSRRMMQERRRRDLGRGRLEPALRRSPTSRSTWSTTDVGVPVLWWRSVGTTHTAYSTEVIHRRGGPRRRQGPGRVPPRAAAGPAAPLRRARLAAEKAGLGHAAARRASARGVAVARIFSTYVAQVAEISVRADGSVEVERVVCAVDCGIAGQPRHHPARRWRAASASGSARS